MTENITQEDLRARMTQLDAEIAELRRAVGGAGAGPGVRDTEEIANDLTSREEQEAILDLLERRRASIVERLRQLDG